MSELEVELKLKTPPNTATKLVQHSFIKKHAINGPIHKNLLTTYFDTPDFLLRANGFSLRVRDVEGNYIQTVKKGAGRSADGIQQRFEWHSEVKKMFPDFNQITEPDLQQLLAEEKLAKRITGLFRTEFQRTTWDLAFPDGSLVELAVDLGAIFCDNEFKTITEMELELKAGEIGKLHEIVGVLEKDIPLKLQLASKAERGYRLRGLK